MKRIESFTVNHLELFSGLYLSRVDREGECVVTTFDLRFTAPNRETPMEVPAIHTLEHLGATYLRNSEEKDKIIYFGPMGCRTGFYLVTFGLLKPQDVYGLIVDTLKFIVDFDGDIPGATPIECGNYSEQDLNGAKAYASKYLRELVEYKRFTYPEKI